MVRETWNIQHQSKTFKPPFSLLSRNHIESGVTRLYRARADVVEARVHINAHLSLSFSAEAFLSLAFRNAPDKDDDACLQIQLVVK